MVYVLTKDGQPLMPTNRYGRVRFLLKNNKAKVIKRCPFIKKLKLLEARKSILVERRNGNSSPAYAVA